jgi:MFS family permease
MAGLVGGYLTPAIGWRAVFALSSVPAAVVAAVVWLWLPESDVWRMGRADRWLNRSDWRSLRPYRRILIALFLMLLVNSEAYWFTYSWMPAYLELNRGLSPAEGGRLVVGMQVSAVLGYLLFGALADRYGRRPMFSIYGAMLAIGLLPPTILWNWAARIPGLIAASMALAGFGTGIWSGAGPLMAELFPTRLRNTALGLMLNVTRGIQFFTPLMITVLSSRFGFGPALALGSVFAAAGAVLVWRLPETRGISITRLDEQVN